MLDTHSDFTNHEPCPACGSKDNLARYSDGHGFCFGCSYYEKAEGEPSPLTILKGGNVNLLSVEFAPVTKRGLHLETCKKWGYGIAEFKNEMVQVANYRNQDGKVVAQKVRTARKEFFTVGSFKNMGLWGEALWRTGGKMLVITEGEIDALSVSQAQGNKWPVASLPSGAAGAVKAVQQSIEWIETFEKVIFMFDMDDPGQEAARDCVAQVSPGKGCIAALPLKDANEMLVAGRTKELISAIWEAKAYRPDGVVVGEELWDRIVETRNTESVAYPWNGLNAKTYGIRRGEVVTLTSGTGQGKSSVCREWQKWLLDQGHKVGIVALEENVTQSAQALMGVSLNCPPHRWPEAEISEDRKRKAFDETVGNGRCILYDHWGSLDPDNLLSRIRYMAKMGCTHLFLDHLSIVVSQLGAEFGNERRLIDNTMTRLRSLVEELQFALIIVSHLKRPEGKSHEEGGQVSLSHLRGSGSIAQLSDICIGMERDQQNEDRKFITDLRILKNRYTGDTGIACSVRYDPLTGRLSEWLDDGDSSDNVPF